MQAIQGEDVIVAIARMKKGKAGGESKIVAECFKHLDGQSIDALAAIFEQWRARGKVPDTLIQLSLDCYLRLIKG